MRKIAQRTLNIVLIETAAGLANVDEIAATPGVDVLHLGHFDLSLSLGIPGQFDHPALQNGIDDIIDACEKHGKAAATLAGDVETAKQGLDRGFRMMSYGYDIGLLQSSLTHGIDQCREHHERYGVDSSMRLRRSKRKKGGKSRSRGTY